ncbi:hypothetical protein B0J14DRAFT_578095 [Halenospora varia]|nr:hypothetical protein B0J14DRAFT_578095 [Halenospora varia]
MLIQRGISFKNIVQKYKKRGIPFFIPLSLLNNTTYLSPHLNSTQPFSTYHKFTMHFPTLTTLATLLLASSVTAFPAPDKVAAEIKPRQSPGPLPCTTQYCSGTAIVSLSLSLSPNLCKFMTCANGGNSTTSIMFSSPTVVGLV